MRFASCVSVQSPFEQLRRGMQDVSGDGGVLKKTITQGVGAEAPEGAIVRVHYNGYLEYSDEPYDSSRLRNRLHQFRLGGGGWTILAHDARVAFNALPRRRGVARLGDRS